MNSGKVVLVLLAGAAAGALAGILLAPAKGSRTRRRVLKKGESWVDSVNGKLDELLNAANEKFKKAKG